MFYVDLACECINFVSHDCVLVSPSLLPASHLYHASQSARGASLGPISGGSQLWCEIWTLCSFDVHARGHSTLALHEQQQIHSMEHSMIWFTSTASKRSAERTEKTVSSDYRRAAPTVWVSGSSSSRSRVLAYVRLANRPHRVPQLGCEESCDACQRRGYGRCLRQTCAVDAALHGSHCVM